MNLNFVRLARRSMAKKEEFEEKLDSVTKELNQLINDFHLKFNNLIEEQRVIKLKIEGRHYDST